MLTKEGDDLEDLAEQELLKAAEAIRCVATFSRKKSFVFFKKINNCIYCFALCL